MFSDSATNDKKYFDDIRISKEITADAITSGTFTGGSFNLDSASYTFKVENDGDTFAENATFAGNIMADNTIHIESVDLSNFTESN